MIDLAPIDVSFIRDDVERALREDIGSGDLTAELLPESLRVVGEIITREPMVMCGQAWAELAFKLMEPEVSMVWHVREGEYVRQAGSLARVSGLARGLLTAERTALNFLGTLSATATETRAYVQQVQSASLTILDTRKTLPGLRRAQKYAVRCGGGQNHRLGLYDAYLIKENHIKAHGSITKVVLQARRTHPDVFLEIEVQTLPELTEALSVLPDRILLDNFSNAMIKDAVLIAKPTGVPLEVSGGVTREALHNIAACGIDCVAVGALTKSVKAIDLSFLLRDD